jgi:hypothetical protein
MGAKFPHFKDIPWDKIDKIKVSKDGKNYSFEFSLNNKKQKITISIDNDSTSYTLSNEDGSPLINATQKGKEIRIFDFTQQKIKKA